MFKNKAKAMKSYRTASGEFAKEHGELAIEHWMRTRLFAEIVSQVEGLVTAKPISLDESRALITYEWIPRLKPCVSQGRDMEERFHSIGMLLARFHQRPLVSSLLNESVVTTHASTGFRLDRKDVILLEDNLPTGMFHGDFWHGNVFIGDKGQVSVLDPIPVPWMFDSHIRACGALDAALFHMSLVIAYPFIDVMTGKPVRLISASNSFIDGYLEEVGGVRARTALLRLSRELARRYVAAYSLRFGKVIAAMKAHLAHRTIDSIGFRVGWESK